VKTLDAEWQRHGAHRDVADLKRDRATVLYRQADRFSRVRDTIRALLQPRRPLGEGTPAAIESAFDVFLLLPLDARHSCSRIAGAAMHPGRFAGASGVVGGAFGFAAMNRGYGKSHIHIGEMRLQGNMEEVVLQRVVRQNVGQYRECYEAGAQRDPGLRGRVGVRLTIRPDGKTSWVVRTAETSLADAQVVECILGFFRRLSFPRPANGSVQVEFPIELAPE